MKKIKYPWNIEILSLNRFFGPFYYKLAKGQIIASRVSKRKITIIVGKAKKIMRLHNSSDWLSTDIRYKAVASFLMALWSFL